jgi:uncharacterized protein (DUF934 family)
MTVIVTDTGFAPDDWTRGFASPEQFGANDDGTLPALDLPPDTDLSRLGALIGRPAMIRIALANFADGRGFTLARNLRRMGYAGRLRAVGHVLADQYAMARRSGFDEVEIDAALAERQPEEHWLRRADWRAHDYQTRLRA